MAFKGLNDNRITVDAGLSVGLIGKTKKARKGLHSDTIEKLLHAYSDLNGIWLLTGKEEMIKKLEIAPNVAPIIAPNVQNDNIIQFKPRVITVDSHNHELVALVPSKNTLDYIKHFSDADFLQALPYLVLPGLTGLSHRAFEVKTAAMSPTHHAGAIAIGSAVDNFSDIKDRKVYIVVTKNDGIMVRRVLNRIKDNGKLILMADNNDKKLYPNHAIYADDVLELWYWRASIIRESPEPGDIYNVINSLEARLTELQNLMLHGGQQDREQFNSL